MTPRESLLELCSDHFHGLISTETYRTRRAELLDNTILGRDPQAVISRVVAAEGPPPAAAERPVDSESRPPRPGPPATAQPPVAARRVPVQWVGGGIAALALVAVLAWWLSGPEPSAPVAVSEPSPAAAGAVAVESPDVAIEEEEGTVVDRFLAADAWDEAALSEFLFEWDLLTDAQRDATRTAAAFRPLDQRLQGRLLVKLSDLTEKF